jgi:hypothetical protein
MRAESAGKPCHLSAGPFPVTARFAREGLPSGSVTLRISALLQAALRRLDAIVSLRHAAVVRKPYFRSVAISRLARTCS